jgi:hypothetical protein
MSTSVGPRSGLAHDQEALHVIALRPSIMLEALRGELTSRN